jgi:hypothetical protein
MDKAARKYLALCGAVPISVIERDGMCSTIRAGGDGLSAQWWIDRKKAVPVARAARRFADAKADLSTATAAVRRLACSTKPRSASLQGGDIFLGSA